MRAIETITGPVSVLNRDDVDTDQIIPKQFLKRVERTGFGQYLFFDWAKQPGWDLPKNPILVAGRNFGCGSSREHAPWALEDYGFQAILAPSFADIFRSNCGKIGLLPIQLTASECAAIAEAGQAQVDLAGQEVRWRAPSPTGDDSSTGDGGGWVGTARFEIDPEIKRRLLGGLDDIAMTLEQGEAIDAYERSHTRPGPLTTQL
jgi:3-isopropylmalate/(R)-2-methylmalate dehydratase small subunit